MLKRILYISSILISIVIVLTLIFDRWIRWKTAPYIFTNVKDLPYCKNAIVPGTAKYCRTKIINQYYLYRIQGALNIYNSGKIKHILLSGDHSKKNYNEPLTMRNDLVSKGIKDSDISLDYNGLSTLDSIFRTRKIFNIDDFIIITQRFHCERAIFIALYLDIQAKCFAVSSPKDIFYIRIREFLARLNTILDLYFLKKQFLLSL